MSPHKGRTDWLLSLSTTRVPATGSVVVVVVVVVVAVVAVAVAVAAVAAVAVAVAEWLVIPKE